MSTKPILNNQLNYEEFEKYYYLKEELIRFCKLNNLPSQGSKIELTKTISYFLKTKQILKNPVKHNKKKTAISALTKNTIIEPNFVCSEVHRAFFKQEIGTQFSFNVQFQKWLKLNPGKTYADAIIAYNEIIVKNKTTKNAIDKQFEYNTYIRDFFADNKGKTLSQAICCWNYKKTLPGKHSYEKQDLCALNK